MKYQYFIIITLTILLFAIPANFAYDNLSDVNTDLLTTKDYYFDTNNTDLGNGSFENPYKNLNDTNLADSSVIHLAAGEYYLHSDRSFSDISFYGSGSNASVLNAGGFKLTNNGNLKFVNITVLNITIQNNGNLNASNTVFKDSSNDFGGVINIASGKNAYLDNCKFINNSAKYGGSIYIFEGNLEIINTHFENNTALIFGGAITSVKSNLKLKNITSFKNNASHEGGVIYTLYGDFSIENSLITNNTAKNGGGLYIDNIANPVVINNTFENNSAEILAGAIYSLANSNITFENNIYINNTALNYNDLLNTTHPSLFIGDNNYTMYIYNSSYTGELPSYYNLADEGYVTSIKSQSTGGNCWSFAAIGALESCILKAANVTFDLSEENMKNLMAYYSDYGWNYMPNTGGLEKMAVGYLTSWLGPVLESDDEYSPSSIISPVLNSIAHIQNVVYITRENYTDNDGIKKAILEYGGVATAIKWSGSSIKGYTRYYDGNDASDHAVIIVGWDDNFSKDNFAKTPEGDGAWIIKNSHGPNSGNNGYWYVSYYDTRCAQIGRSDVSYTFILNDTMKYDKNYQYDIPGRTDFFLNESDTIWYKNIFKSTDNEYLTAVSTHFQKITNYTIYIKINGELKHTQEGSADTGYYTINLHEPVLLNINDTFEVIFKITVDNEAAFPISEFISLNKLMYKENISFLSYDGEEWTDLFNMTWAYSTHTYKSQVACIKAFTVLNLTNTSLKLTDLNITQGFNIRASVLNQYGNPVTGGRVVFTLSNQTYTSEVINGIADLILKVNPGNYNITAVYICEGHISSNDTLNVNVSKINTTLILNVSNEHNPVNITAFVLNQHGFEVAFGNVTFNLDGVNYTVSVVNGSACLCRVFDVYSSHNISAVYEDAYYYSSSFDKTQFNVSVIDTNIALTVSGEFNPVFINITVRDYFANPVDSGNVTYCLDGVNYTVPVVNGSALVNYTFDVFGLNNISVFYNSSYYYAPSFGETLFNVSLMETNISLNVFNVNNPFIFNVTVTDHFGNPVNWGNVTYCLDGVNYTVNVTNGSAMLNHTFDVYGLHNLSVLYSGLNYYNSSYSEIMFNFPLINTNLSLSVSGDYNPVVFNVTVTDQFGNPVDWGNVTYCLDGVNYTVNVTNGSAMLNHTFDVFGLHNISLLYNGLYYYNSSYMESSFNVSLKDTNISLSILNKFNPFFINITVKDKFANPVQSGNLTLNIDNINTTLIITNGTACLNHTFTQFGAHNITVSYKDGYYYASSQITNIITVNSTVIAYDSTNVLNSMYSFKILDNNGNPLNNSNVSVLLNSKTYNLKTDENGTASLNIALNVGKYSIKITNSVNNDCLTKYITVISRITENKPVTMYYGAGKYYKVRVRSDNAGFTGNLKVTFTINKKTYYVNTDKKGYASLKISQKPGTYTITASYKGYKVSNKVTVKSTIVTKNINVKKSKTIKFTAKLLNSKGKILKNKQIKFKFKGKTYKVKTNKKGIATLKITKKYKSGKYTVTTTYGKLTVKNTIKIK